MVLDSCVETVKVVMEVSKKAAEVVIATARTTIELLLSGRRSLTSLTRPHPVPAMASLQDMGRSPAASRAPSLRPLKGMRLYFLNHLSR